MVMRLSLDSAGGRNPIVNIIVSKQAGQTAFNRFIVLFLFSARQHLRISFLGSTPNRD
jgi:hypothetical protein